MDKFLLHLAIAFNILGSSAGAEIITNPEQHYLSDTSHEPKCQWRIVADLNADQLSEELLTFEENRNGKAGHIWHVYIGIEGGYKAAGKPISFRSDAVFIGHIHEIDEPGLLVYLPASGRRGILLSYQVKQEQLAEINLGQIQPLGSDAVLYQQYFGLFNPVIEKKPLFGGICGEF